MPKTQEYVLYKDGDDLVHAFVVGAGKSGPGHLALEWKKAGTSDWGVNDDAPQGEASGCWREP